MKFKCRPLAIPDVMELTPRAIEDSRGYFSETYNSRDFDELGIKLSFVQDNQSFSQDKFTLRGLHFQMPPYAQDKLVRVIKGTILDIAVDLRKSSPTFGKWVSLELSAHARNQLLVPIGFAHGFLTLEPETEVLYKVTNYYSQAHDAGIRWNDSFIGIEWGLGKTQPHLSHKDASLPFLKAVENPFT